MNATGTPRTMFRPLEGMKYWLKQKLNKMYMKEHYCRICGLYIEDEPWGEDGYCPTHEICPCCGVEFGYEDYTIESIIEYRNQWIKNGAEWFIEKQRPEDWSLEKQMQNIPSRYKNLDITI
jgi:hypothetical protein